MPLSHRFFRTVRSIHLYLGIFAAPMLLFLAFTGGLQSFGLHETTRGSSYAPPHWLITAAQFHKKQTTVVPASKFRPPAPATPRESANSSASAKMAPSTGVDAQPKKNLLPMKAFFALVALSLFVSILSGLCLAWRYTRRPALFGAVLGAGIVVPLLLWLF